MPSWTFSNLCLDSSVLVIILSSCRPCFSIGPRVYHYLRHPVHDCKGSLGHMYHTDTCICTYQTNMRSDVYSEERTVPGLTGIGYCSRELLHQKI
ncbi:hypothetical protein GGR52DRAFT_540535 [Hypoxylon sp. FL1284]|nr:hypothetical protein GGR52DRAFT_540535 [Hypoxylon sp. FL1284]